MTDEERQSRAGEYVLGVLEGAELIDAEAALDTDPAFRAAVQSFAAKMGRLDLTAQPDQVADGMWERIAAAIEGQPQGTAELPNVVRLRQRSTHNARWLGLAQAAAVVLALGIGYLGGQLAGSRPQPVVMVVLQTPENSPGAVFEAYADNAVRIIPLQDFVVPEGKIMQAWTLYDRDVGPVSLGTLSPGNLSKSQTVVLDGHAWPVPADDQLYEITLEPAPGSPTGKPTGPILVKGFAQTTP